MITRGVSAFHILHYSCKEKADENASLYLPRLSLSHSLPSTGFLSNNDKLILEGEGKRKGGNNERPLSLSLIKSGFDRHVALRPLVLTIQV